jgi:ribosomal protein S1
MTSLRKPVDLVTEGQVIVGTVCDVAPFGLFVEIVPGRLDGLLRFGSALYPEIARLFKSGERIEVVVRTIDLQREAVYLDLLPDPTRYDGFWWYGEGGEAGRGAADDRPRD